MNRIPDKMMYRSRFRTCLSILWAGLLPLLLNAQENRRSAWFDDEAGFTDVENFMRRNAPALGITEAAADYRVKKEEQDAEGSRHINIQRTQEGMDVVGGDGWIHVRANGTAWYGGGYVPSLGRLPQTGERRSAGACIAIALDHVSKGRPALDEGTGGTEVSLVVTRRDEHAPWGPGNTTLAYEVDLAELHLEQSSLLVDALDGRVLEERRHPKCVHTGTTNTLYDGPREFCTSLWDGNYFLKDDVWRYNTIRTFDVAAPEAFEIFSPNGVFNENAFEIAAASLHWAGQQTVKYFYYAHDLHIHDYLGGYLQLKMNSRTTAPQFQGDYSPDYAGAFSPRTAEFGMGGILTSGPYVAPDIVGHEVGHLIVYQRITGYSQAAESGALHEAFSDMFGTLVEAYARPTSWNYLIGQDLDYEGTNGYLRNMANPNLKGHPDTYLGTNWLTTPAYLMPHTNAGVVDYWFHLLSEGGSGTNDNAFAYNVAGVGRVKAAQIALKTAMNLFATADFSDARNASMFAVIDLFGYCSEEAKQVIKAWDAVGVAANTDPVVITPDGTVDCAELTAIHGASIPYDRWFLGNGTINCAGIYPNGVPVRVHAVKSVTMLPGFYSGDHFSATIEDCPVIMKSSSPNEDIARDPAVEIGHTASEPFRLYPNPTTGQVLLVWAPDVVPGTASSLRVLDMNGRVVRMESVFQGPRVSMDLQGEPAGAYIVEVGLEGNVHRERLILMQ